LKNTIYYYENIAQAKDDPVRQRVISDTIVNLKDVLFMLESKIDGLDKEIKRLQSKVDRLFECPELKNFKVSNCVLPKGVIDMRPNPLICSTTCAQC
jgi:hypothetical protein